MSKDSATDRFLHPRYWPTWFMLASLRLASLLPYRLQLRIGALLGALLYRFNRHRRRVTETNIRLIFPDLDPVARQRMVRDVFRHNGIGLLETAMAWWMPVDRLPQKIIFKGREHLDQALQQGRGIVLLGAHFSTLDLGGLLFSQYYEVDAMYRKHNNPLMDRYIRKGRSRYFGQAIERSDIRSVIRALRKNRIVWYAPDQDMGSRNSVYAEFFGVPAATITATSRMVKLNDSPILMLAQHRLPDDSGYELELFPVIEPFPSDDVEADAARINAEIERAIRKDPAQYMWVHRRFKTHPRGKNYLYRQGDS
ncbi:lipid A biosynthesis lauroyltransferase [Marinobacterium zhoushanense]|uniref:Lipid A biosynthesis acyltransferase n=1 Tax=Marinobacterium zhoushanense TaxID=1679163 RepID=A0ABQ1KI01_9GAMM|nr:LpxL/LpxP family Kdo(2)-lipid IV(A) lauroyl/palmitoleoyl acyltransferase [Marinobacterium zhoushanense]GGB97421.1 lipid A biosynthesis lauroyltransferase [Marinobacterium zhoushanense]